MRNSTVVKAIYNGNGVTRRWDVPFEYLDTSEIEVILTTVVDDVNVEEHIPANEYSIDTSSNEVIYPSDMSKSPVEEGKKVTIHRVTDLFQESDYTNQGALWPESVEASFDKVHQILQEHQEGIGRSVKVDITGNDDPQQYFNEIIETAKLGLIKAGEAIAAAENAAASEANAAASELNAANSAAAALASQQAAALSETHAATSETNAAASETTAVASANRTLPIVRLRLLPVSRRRRFRQSRQVQVSSRQNPAQERLWLMRLPVQARQIRRRMRPPLVVRYCRRCWVRHPT